jgi:hypothetical protein
MAIALSEALGAESNGVVRQKRCIYTRKVKKLFVRRSFWKEAPQRVIAP